MYLLQRLVYRNPCWMRLFSGEEKNSMLPSFFAGLLRVLVRQLRQEYHWTTTKIILKLCKNLKYLSRFAFISRGLCKIKCLQRPALLIWNTKPLDAFCMRSFLDKSCSKDSLRNEMQPYRSALHHSEHVILFFNFLF